MHLTFKPSDTKINEILTKEATIETQNYTINIMLLPYDEKTVVPTIEIIHVNAVNIMDGYKFTGHQPKSEETTINDMIKLMDEQLKENDSSRLIAHLLHDESFHHRRIGQTVSRLNHNRSTKRPELKLQKKKHKNITIKK